MVGPGYWLWGGGHGISIITNDIIQVYGSEWYPMKHVTKDPSVRYWSIGTNKEITQ